MAVGHKSVGTGLDCGLRCTPALSVTQSADASAVCDMWRYIGAVLFLLFAFGVQARTQPCSG